MEKRLGVVTGVSSGIGKAVSRVLLTDGWDVIGISRRSISFGERFQHIELDLADLDALVTTFETEIAPIVRDERWDRIGLVNNAASPALLAPMETIGAADLAKLYSVNLVAPIWLMGFVSRHAAPDIALRIVNVSSAAGVQAFPGLAAYGSSKAGLRMAGMVLTAEWQSNVEHAPTRRNASVLSYEPGAVDTPMQGLARSRPAEDFPWVGMFTSMRDRGVLVSPDQPAREIVDYLEGNQQSGFREARLG